MKRANFKLLSMFLVSLVLLSVLAIAQESDNAASQDETASVEQAISNVESCPPSSPLGNMARYRNANVTYNITTGQGFLLNPSTQAIEGVLDFALVAKNCQPKNNASGTSGTLALRHSADGLSPLKGTRLSVVSVSSTSSTDTYDLKFPRSRGTLVLSAINKSTGAPNIQMRTGNVTFTDKNNATKTYNIEMASYKYTYSKPVSTSLRSRIAGFFVRN